MGDRLGRSLQMAVVFLLLVSLVHIVGGLPSGGSYPPVFSLKEGDWFDSWGFDRNYYGDSDGYMPNVAYETLGTNKELAYSLGEQFRTVYSSKVRRAEEILKYVQRWTEYGYDSDNVVMNGVAQEEWAWNADEMAHRINTTTNAVAVGDCEDLAFLCATIYSAAGFDVAMVLAPQHVALLIWLPEYSNANYYWDIPSDGRDKGWIWVEATGPHNPLGWTPPDFNDGDWTTYPLGLIISNVSLKPENPQAENDVVVTASIASVRASINQVLLNYSIQGGAYDTLIMTPKESTYEATIPKQSKGTGVDFRISATDSEGNTIQSDKLSYTVGGGGFEIPGFPSESIVIGFILGIALLVFLMRRKPTSITSSTSTYSLSA